MDFFLEWDTDVHSTSLSDRSTFVADYHGRCLRRTLDLKVRKLRDMMAADEDVTTEIDRVVCRLMKLALRSSRGRQNPPPTKWMQCKLLDLLTLTEKAIERRKRHFIETYPLKAVGYEEEKPVEMKALKKIREDDTGTHIVDKYRHLLRPSDKTLDGAVHHEIQYMELGLYDDFVSITSNEFVKDFDYIDRRSPSPVNINIHKDPIVLCKAETPLERTQAWVDEDIEVVPYPSHEVNFDNASDTDHSAHDSKRKQKKTKKYKITSKNTDDANIKACKRTHSKTSHDKKKKHDKNKRKSSTRITKKVTRKISNGLVKNASNKCVAMEYGNYVVNSQEKSRDYQHLLVASKPIPESITELCPPKIDLDNIGEFKASASEATDLTNGTVTLNEPHNDIAATKESLLIAIVTDGLEETIAMRRTVGTDAEHDPTDYENEIVIGSVSNEICTKHNVSTDNVHSNTIFLNDINEPSTSKGIRHVSMDVQCGPDVTPTYSALSASPSLAKMTDMAALGPKMNALFAEVNIKSTDFGTSTQSGYYETISPRVRSVGIKIRDSDTNIVAKVEGSTMTRVPPEIQKTVTIAEPQVTMVADSLVSPTETKLIKPISSTLKIEDSGSEYFESVGSFARSPVHFGLVTSKNASDMLLESSESKEAGVMKKFTKYVRPTLSRGGIHVHSYKDKQVSEDVVYQGEWQRCRPKVVARKNSYIPTATRKKIDLTLRRKKFNSKEKIALKKLEKKEVKLEPKKPVPTRTLPTRIVPTRALPTRKAILNQMKPASKNVLVKAVDPNKATNVSRLPRHVMNNVKIASKFTTSSMATKNVKFSCAVKKATPIPAAAVKKVDNKIQQLKENYIPLYLRKNKQKLIINNKTSLNKSIDSVNAMIKVNKSKLERSVPPLVRSKTEEIKKELLRFPDEPRENISFLVFRNDKEDNKDTKEQSTHITDSNVKKTGCIIKRIQSYQSPNSSTCSSPNSVATVRAATAKIKNTSTRRHSSSSYKASTINSGSDTSSPTKNKKFVKRSKSAKRADSKDLCNKENIPETSPKNNLNKENGKVPFVGRHRNVFIAQLNTESSHLEFTANSLSKHQTKPQVSNKSNIKIPVQVDTNDTKIATSPSVSRRRSSKLSTSSAEHKFSSSSPERSNMVLVLERHQPRPAAVKSRNVSPIPADDSVKMFENNLLTEWTDTTSLISSNSSNIAQSMRQLIVQMLDFVDSPFDDIDSETVILSRDDGTNDDQTSGNESINMSPSPTSFQTVITYEDANSKLIENDIEDVLNRTLDSVLGEESNNSLNDTRQTATDLDFLSIKSVTSASKYSEYFLADNEMNDPNVLTPAPVPLSLPTSNSVRDIFERKDNNLLQGPAGALAVQAFSGFSIAGEPVAGDQPDPISIIDSETGSVALDVGRQATSEELFVSGRSSDSYESCVIDEDAVVPNWLFNIISHQQPEAVENNPAPQLPIPIPLPDPIFDGNGNVVDQGIVGLGAGAGDGRGIHSDHSQDSSGRGTSLSSSEVSSDPQSEAILIDPSAFGNQFELMREPIDSVINVPTTDSSSTVDTYRIEGSDNTTGSSSAGRSIRPIIPPLVVTSDVDADISSIGTDVPDSSDN